MRFQLNKGCGSHVERDGKKYIAGDTIETDDDLIAMFGDIRFSLLGDYSPDTAVVPSEPDIPGPVSDTDEEDLTPTSKSVSQIEEEDDQPQLILNPDGQFGNECTEEFDSAIEAELKVFGKKQWFTVIDPDDGTVLNEKKLRKKDVDDFCAEYIPEAEEDTEEDE